MEIAELFAILFKRKWIIIATTTAAILGTILAISRLTPVYETYATLRVMTVTVGDLTWVDYNLSYTKLLANTYTTLSTSGPIYDRIRAELGIQDVPEITVEQVPNTELVSIRVESEDPQLAADVANVLVNTLIEEGTNVFSEDLANSERVLQELEQESREKLTTMREEYRTLLGEEVTPESAARLEELDQQISVEQTNYQRLSNQLADISYIRAVRSNQVRLVEPAYVPDTPSGPNTTLYIVLGVGGGFLAGVVLALLFHVLDRRPRSVVDFAAEHGLTVMGRIPSMWGAEASLLKANEESFLFHTFERLAIEVLHEVGGGHLQRRAKPEEIGKRAISVVSAAADEGKSMVAFGLAVALGRRGLRTLMIDADLSSIPTYSPYVYGLPLQQNPFDLMNIRRIFSRTLGRTSPAQWVSIRLEDGFSINAAQPFPQHDLHLAPISSLKPVIDPTHMLSIDETIDLFLQHVRDSYDFVIIDSPPMLLTSEAVDLLPLVDGSLIVVSARETNEEQAHELVEMIQRTDERIIGVVENHADVRDQHQSYERYAVYRRKNAYFRRMMQTVSERVAEMDSNVPQAPRNRTVRQPVRTEPIRREPARPPVQRSPYQGPDGFDEPTKPGALYLNAQALQDSLQEPEEMHSDGLVDNQFYIGNGHSNGNGNGHANGHSNGNGYATGTETNEQNQAEAIEPDDLTIIEGIGPKYSATLFEMGIVTFADLAACTEADLVAIFNEAGMRKPSSISTWAQQARLAAVEDWAGLEALQEQLTAGRESSNP
ncbi:MAG: AAA family ATPase [Anaerolineae bacterium]|nr:AAA family ATPase [Anaerolineae bacterium]